jgi:cysteine protease ATG4
MISQNHERKCLPGAVIPPSSTDLDVLKSTRSTIPQTENKFGSEETEEKEKELDERPLSIVPDKDVDAPGGFDVCKEYGYKYEYAQDYPPGDDTEEQPLESSPSHTLHSLHRTTAVVTKTNERLPYVHVLGKTYHPVHNYHDRKEYEKSLFWFTYRCDFPQIAPYGIDTDAGWGCMLRSAQMLLGHALRVHFKSRNWSPPSDLQAQRRDEFVKKLLTWFADFPSKTDSVYSLHNFVAAGNTKYEVLPGEWWGPGTACYVIRDLVELHQQTQPSLFRVHVSTEGTVYQDAVYELMTRDSKKRALERKKAEAARLPLPLHPLDPIAPSGINVDVCSLDWDTSLLLLVPLRLGLDKLNDDYVHSLARSFGLPQSVGILGGRPRGARWFFGAYADGTKVLGLDPHTVQQAPRRNGLQNVQLSDDYLQSVHTGYPEVYQIDRMDPSLAIGFYCRDRKDFIELESSLKELKKVTNSPDLFTFVRKTPNYLASAMEEMMLGSATFEEDGATERNDDSDDEDYVLL